MAESTMRPADGQEPMLLALPGLQAHQALAVAIAALSEADALGHTGISLSDLAAQSGYPHDHLATVLRQQLASDGDIGDRPLILLDDWVTSRRTWQHEWELARDIIDRAALRRGDGCDDGILEDLQRWFPHATPGNGRQRLAVVTALSRGLSLITGGPGRGKTHVAGALVAISAAAQRRHGGRPLRVCLSAPTGKAAARLRGSIVHALDQEVHVGRMTREEELRLSQWSTTLHRLFSDRSKADIDLLIIDEVSMASAATLHRALAGIPQSTRIVLLGDADQLFSVDPGRVLADIAAYGRGSVDTAMAVWYQQHWPLPECTTAARDTHPLDAAQVRLLINHRSAGTPVAVLADACLADSSSDGLASLLEHMAQPVADHQGAWVVRCDPPPAPRLIRELYEHAASTVAALTSAESPEEALRVQASWLILAALRRGPYGAEALTRDFERHLAMLDVISPDGSGNYRARPVLVTSNHPDLELSNGDLGILWQQEHGPYWDLVIDAGASCRRVPLQRIGSWQPAWIMTVHKSQGSQAGQVDVIGPGPDVGNHRLLSRELIYTAITRARERLRLWMSTQQVLSAVARHSQRVSGFSRALQIASAALTVSTDQEETPHV